MDYTDETARSEYIAIKTKTVGELVLELECLGADGWHPTLYLGRGVVILQRPFSTTPPAVDDELGDLDLTEGESEDPLVTRILEKYQRERGFPNLE